MDSNSNRKARLTQREMHKLVRVEGDDRSLSSPYVPHEPGNAIPLYRGLANVIWEGAAHPLEIESRLEFSPSPRSVVEIVGGSPPLVLAGDRTAVMHVDESHETYACLLFTSRIFLREPLRQGRVPAIDSIRFHLFNFPDFFWKTGIHTGRIGPLDATFGNWQIRVEDASTEQEKRRQSEAVRSYILSHVGEIRRTDGKAVTPKQWSKVAEFLGYVFGFCAGHRCPPLVVEGLNKKGTVVWRDQSVPRLAHNRSHSHWFPRPYPTDIGHLIQNAWAAWQREDQREALQRAIEWYWEAADRGITIETRIVLAQVALELLAWVVMVEQSPRLSRSGFDGLSASDRILLLANQLEIDPAIPKHFVKLVGTKGFKKWEHAPMALTEIRNRIVHPERHGRTAVVSLSWETKHQAAEWGVWLIELSILWLSQYEGRYDSRVAHPEQGFPFVPWVDGKQEGAKGCDCA